MASLFPRREEKTMAMETIGGRLTLTRYGAKFSAQTSREGIEAVLGDQYTEYETELLTEYLQKVFRDAVNALLPDGAVWTPATSEFLHPEDVEIPDAEAMAELFEQAWAEVEKDLLAHEQAALAGLQVAYEANRITGAWKVAQFRADMLAQLRAQRIEEAVAKLGRAMALKVLKLSPGRLSNMLKKLVAQTAPERFSLVREDGRWVLRRDGEGFKVVPSPEDAVLAVQVYSRTWPVSAVKVKRVGAIRPLRPGMSADEMVEYMLQSNEQDPEARWTFVPGAGGDVVAVFDLQEFVAWRR